MNCRLSAMDKRIWGHSCLKWKVSMIYPPVRKPFSQFTVEGFIASLPWKGRFCTGPTKEETAAELSSNKM